MGGAARASCTSQLTVSLFNVGIAGCSDADRAVSRRRWARTIMRARVRRPCFNCRRCSVVYADDDISDDMRAHIGFFLSVLLIPLLRAGLGGMQADLSAVAAKQLAAMYQSADLGERAVSLGRDYIDEPVSKVVPRSLSRTFATSVRAYGAF